MTAPSHALLLEAYGPVLEDRARVIEADGILYFALADGAGGIADGEQAAEHATASLSEFIARRPDLTSERSWTGYLADLDQAIARAPDTGQTTLVAIAVTPRTICGASVGDSEAWVINDDGCIVLTDRQRRKPFVGSGMAEPRSFRIPNRGGTLLVGSDGLFKYADRERILRTTQLESPEAACRALIDLARLPNGRLQDDVGVVVCRLSESSLPLPN